MIRLPPVNVGFVLFWSFNIFWSVNWLKGLLLEIFFPGAAETSWFSATSFYINFGAFVFYPISGLIGDSYVRRYTFMKVSVFILWTGAVVSSLVLSLENAGITPSSSMVHGVLIAALSLGMIGFHANVVPFGLEQLQAAPQEMITAFILYYLFSEALALVLTNTVVEHRSCTDRDNQLLESVICTFLLTLCAIMPTVFTFVVEETTAYNPIKLVYHWIKQRYFIVLSSGNHTRISFTEKQLQDMRACLHIIPIIFIYMPATIISTTSPVMGLFSYHLNHAQDMNACYILIIIAAFIPIVLTIAVPLYHLCLYPTFHQYIPSMLQRFKIGICLFTSSMICCFFIDLADHILSYPASIFQPNMPSGDSARGISYLWVFLPAAISGAANFVLVFTMYEFICAKSPYAMKGLLMGLQYGAVGIGTVFEIAIIMAFRFVGGSWSNLSISSDTFYFLFHIILGFLIIFLFTFYERKYTPLKRFNDEDENRGLYFETSSASYLESTI